MSVVPDYLSAFQALAEPIPCPLCGGNNHEPVYEGVALRGNDLVCVACRDCAHLHINPRPPMSAYKEFYGGNSYFHLCAEFSHVTLEEKLAQFEDDSYWRDRFGYGERLCRRYLDGCLGTEDLVIDLGCGDGAWLWALQELTGCRVGAQEISDVYAEVVSRKLGIDVFLGPVEEVGADIVAAHRDEAKVVIVSGSLQHMLDPLYCLGIAREVLAEDGLLYICNWSLFEHYMAPYSGDEERFYGATRRLLGEVLSWEHAHYFHEASMRFMVERAGFEIIDSDLESVVRPRHMDLLARPRSTDAAPARPGATVQDVVSRLRALEAAVIASRLSDSVG